MINELEQNIEDYETAAMIAKTDFSQLGEADFAQVETRDNGEKFGIVQGVAVPIAPQIEAPAPAPEEGSIRADIRRGVVRGAQSAAESLNETLPLLGKPVDWMNEGLREVGEYVGVDLSSDNPVGGSEMIRDGVSALLNFGNQLLPQGVNEAYSEYVNQPPKSPITQTIVEAISEFGVQAVTPALYLRAFTVMSPFARGLAWGGIADFINAKPDDTSATQALTELLAGATEQERGAVANAVLQVFAQQEGDPEIVNRARMALDGMIIGGSAEKILGGIPYLIRAARTLPVKNTFDAIGGAAMSAVRGVDQALDRGVEMMGGGNTLGMGVGPVPKAAEAATDLDEQGFFSAMSRAVDALPMDKGTGDQMRAMIAKGEGVKAEEMAWTGLDDFLAGKQSVTKAEIKEFTEANQVQIEEVVRADEGVTQNISYLRNEYRLMVEGRGLYANLPPSYREERTKQMLADIEAMEADGIVGPTKFGDYTLPGGENYREVLLKLPAKTGAETNAARYDELNQIAARRNLTDAESDEMLAIEQAEFSGTSGTAGDDFVSGHFNEKNVLAHIRLNDRTGPDGERILFIEEIQSDWHQKGRKQGYQGGSRFAGKLSAKEMDGGIGWEITDENGTFVTNVLKTEGPGHIQFEPAGAGTLEQTTIATADDALSVAQRRIDNPDVGSLPRDDRVPDAPLKKNWHEMSFRRVARMAAEEGYDAIAWTPGKVQAERYDLSKQIDELRYQKNDDGTFNIVPAKDGQTIQAEEFENLAEDRLAEVVGKEVAEKIVKGEGVADSGTSNAQILRGVDLQVGGEGMKGFYDKMLKKYAEKWGKKFGSKVGVTKIARDYPEMADDQKLLDDLGVEATGSPHHEVWSMPVTPKMRDSVLKKGVPLFSAAGAAAATGAAMQNEKQPASQRVF